jgi:hypothetical protein
VSDVVIYLSCFGKVVSEINKGRHIKIFTHIYTHTHRQEGDLTSLILFFKNKENALKIIPCSLPRALYKINWANLRKYFHFGLVLLLNTTTSRH